MLKCTVCGFNACEILISITVSTITLLAQTNSAYKSPLSLNINNSFIRIILQFWIWIWLWIFGIKIFNFIDALILQPCWNWKFCFSFKVLHRALSFFSYTVSSILMLCSLKHRNGKTKNAIRKPYTKGYFLKIFRMVRLPSSSTCLLHFSNIQGESKLHILSYFRGMQDMVLGVHCYHLWIARGHTHYHPLYS